MTLAPPTTARVRDIRRACDSSACFCSCPPVRLIPSTGQRYTVEQLTDREVDALGLRDGALYFRYRYMEAGIA